MIWEACFLKRIEEKAQSSTTARTISKISAAREKYFMVTIQLASQKNQHKR